MIDFVQGYLVSIEEETIILNVNGIGYLIYVPRPEAYQSLLDKECFVYTHHHMREDWMGLYGFKDKEERFLFRLLLSVSGIGPKVALAIIAQGNPSYIIKAIASEDEKALVKMPGIGKKTAQRIILDLKDKVKGLKIEGNANVHIDNLMQEESLQGGSDLHDALKALGYSDQEIFVAVQGLGDSIEKEPLDFLIKKALQLLLRG